jgi:hypothetical protein
MFAAGVCRSKMQRDYVMILLLKAAFPNPFVWHGSAPANLPVPRFKKKKKTLPIVYCQNARIQKRIPGKIQRTEPEIILELNNSGRKWKQFDCYASMP